MKVAVTVWGNRISPVFDSAQTILFADIADGTVLRKKREFIPDASGPALATILVEKKIETLICGAISKQPGRIIESGGIKLIAFVAGKADQILQSYASGDSIHPFLMPGCCRMRRAKRGTEWCISPER